MLSNNLKCLAWFEKEKSSTSISGEESTKLCTLTRLVTDIQENIKSHEIIGLFVIYSFTISPLYFSSEYEN